MPGVQHHPTCLQALDEYIRCGVVEAWRFDDISVLVSMRELEASTDGVVVAVLHIDVASDAAHVLIEACGVERGVVRE